MIIKYLQKIKKRLVKYIIKKHYYTVIHRLIKNNNQVITKDKKYLKEVKDYWSVKGYRINGNWHTFYSSLNGIKSVGYIPKDIFNQYVESEINYGELGKAYEDKNMYDIFFEGINKPKTILRCMNGCFCNEAYESLKDYDIQKLLNTHEGHFFLKPSLDSGSGKNVNKVLIKDGTIFLNDVVISINQLSNQYHGNFLIQREVLQNKMLAKVNPYSLNTIRPISIRMDNKIKILSYVIRFGNGQVCIDNTFAGGVACGIHKDGNLGSVAFDRHYNKHLVHPYTGEKFDTFKIPNFHALDDFVTECHNRLPYFDIVTWDIGIDNQEQFIFIECHINKLVINYHQVLNGPVFNEVIDYLLSS